MRWLIVALCLIPILALADPLPNAGIVDIYHFSISGTLDTSRGGFATGCWQLNGAVGATLTGYCGGYQLGVNGAPARVQYAGIWPTGIAVTQGEAWSFDGAASYLDRADDGTFDPSDDFSVQAVVMPDTVAAGEDCIVAKYETTGNQRGWKLCRVADAVVFTTSADGAAVTAVTRTTALAVHRISVITATYDKSLTTARIYVDAMATASSGVMSASIHDSTANFEIGASDTGATIWDGRIYDIVYKPHLMSEADHDFNHAQWRGLVAASGNYATVASALPPSIMASPPASGAEPFFLDQPPNTAMVGSKASGVGGVYSAFAFTNLCHRASFETWAAGSPTGWTETSGGGTSDATQNTTTMAHHFSSAQMVCDGVNTLTLDSACKTFNATSPYHGSVWVKTTAGTANFSVQLIEYTSVNCTTGATVTTLQNGNPGATWVKYGGFRTTGGAVQSGRLRLSIQTAAATVVVDGAAIYNNNIESDSICVADTDANVACNHVDITIANPLIFGNETVSICATVRPISDPNNASIYGAFCFGGTYAANNSCTMYSYTNFWRWRCWDSVGASITFTFLATGGRDVDAYLCGSWVSDGNMWAYHGMTSYGPVLNGTRNADPPEIQVGGYSGLAFNYWVQNMHIYRKLRQ